MTKASRVSKLSVALTPDLADLVSQAVAEGQYASSSEVIREALREWKLRRDVKLHERAERRQLSSDGLVTKPEPESEPLNGEARRWLGANQG
jgi:antitoxin ParD1/3/4